MLRVVTCLTGEHDLRLVALASAICFCASFAAIRLFHSAAAARGPMQSAGLARIAISGTVAGCGIWLMHFIAMLAYVPGVAAGYDRGLTALSLIAAIVMTVAGFGFAARGSKAFWTAAAAGWLIGAGIACMHYLGMAALQLPGRVAWSLDLVVASIAIGLVLSAAAIVVAVRHATFAGALAAAALLSLAIVTHHFTAMGAFEVTLDPAVAIAADMLSRRALGLMVAAGVIGLLVLGGMIWLRRRRAAALLHESNLRLSRTLDNLAHGVIVYDAQGRLVLCNEPYIEMYGLSRDIVRPGATLQELIQHRVERGVLFVSDPEKYAAHIINSVNTHKPFITRNELTNGRVISVVNRPTPDGGCVVTHLDITERHKAEKELEETKAFLDLVIENVPAPVIVKDAHDFKYVFVNRASEEYFGCSRDQMLGRTAAELFSPETADAVMAQEIQLLAARAPRHFEEQPVETVGRGMRIVSATRLPVMGADGQPRYLVAVLQDVTERKRAEARIARLAHYDTLTDLPNRAAFNECFAATIERATRESSPFAVLCLDLDRFKEVNDVFGHAAGDALLRWVTARLSRAAETAFLARIGGDEFALVVSGRDAAAGAARIAERMLAAVDEDFEIDGNRLRIGVSVGVAIYPADGADAETLIANADAALYRAKADGAGTIRFYEADMDARLRERRALVHDLREAVARDELVLHYQPQATIGGEITGFEALVRWRHPGRGLLPPAKFIPGAEESGLILGIGAWILREACREAASWPKPLNIAVNLSPVQFRHGDLVGLVHTVLLETGLAPGRLELEITESVLIEDFAHTVSLLRRLKALGVHIAMDDFGTGYSSLSNLQAFAFDKIKIDQSFIAKLEKNEQSATIVRAVIGLGRGLALPISAEGVETQAQLAFLSTEDCGEVQGFLVGKPLPISAYAGQTGGPAEAQDAAPSAAVA
ncbi:MAG TPA: EAL domain-containing protein [Xanthobacteraceae bacterium]